MLDNWTQEKNLKGESCGDLSAGLCSDPKLSIRVVLNQSVPPVHVRHAVGRRRRPGGASSSPYRLVEVE